MSDVLDQICERKRTHIAARKQAASLHELEDQAKAQRPVRGFTDALLATHAAGRLPLIAEIKKASPSKGLIRADFDPPALARAYRAGGAACLSVLTDQPYFQGEDAFVASVGAAVDLPILRKDFMLDPYQVVEARAIGADCILVIMAAVDDALAAELSATARQLRLDILVEVHDADELERALRLDGSMVGINNRNLKTLKVDLDVTRELAAHVPEDRLLVAESGLYDHGDLLSMQAAGARAFLVGESLMRQADVTAATRALLSMDGQAA